MTTMLERVARALCVARGWNPDTCVMGGGSVSADGKSASHCYIRMWENCFPEARAAIEAMREPSDAMWEAALDSSLARKGWTAQYQAAIDAALSGEPLAEGVGL